MISSREIRETRNEYYARFGRGAQCPGMLIGGGPFKSEEECYKAMKECLEKGEPYVYPDIYKVPENAVI